MRRRWTVRQSTILDELNQFNRPFIYTSGCWVLGNTGDRVADEDYAARAHTAGGLASGRRATGARRRGMGCRESCCVRPWSTTAGRPGRHLRRVGPPAQRCCHRRRRPGCWTFVHVDDLADLYVRALGLLPGRCCSPRTSGAAGAERGRAASRCQRRRRSRTRAARRSSQNHGSDGRRSGARSTNLGRPGRAPSGLQRPKAPTVLEELENGAR